MSVLMVAAVLPRAGEQNRQQPRGGRVGRLKRKLFGKEGGEIHHAVRILYSRPEPDVRLQLRYLRLLLRKVWIVHCLCVL